MKTTLLFLLAACSGPRALCPSAEGFDVGTCGPPPCQGVPAYTDSCPSRTADGGMPIVVCPSVTSDCVAFTNPPRDYICTPSCR